MIVTASLADLGIALFEKLLQELHHQRGLSFNKMDNPWTKNDGKASDLSRLLLWVVLYGGGYSVDPATLILFEIAFEDLFIDLRHVDQSIGDCTLLLLELLDNIVQARSGLLNVFFGLLHSTHSSSEHDIAYLATAGVLHLVGLLFLKLSHW